MSSSLSLLEPVPELSSLLGLNNILLLYPLGAYMKQNVMYRRKEFKLLPCMCSLTYLCDTSSPLGYLLRCAIAGFSNSLIRLEILTIVLYMCMMSNQYILPPFHAQVLGCVSSVFSEFPVALDFTYNWMLWHYDFI